MAAVKRFSNAAKSVMPPAIVFIERLPSAVREETDSENRFPSPRVERAAAALIET
jgi:hypothetical protein